MGDLSGSSGKTGKIIYSGMAVDFTGATVTGLSLGATPGGSDTYVQFNSSGSLGGSINLVWVSPALRIGNPSATTGQLKLANAASAFIATLQAGVNITSDRVYKWAADFGAPGSVLTDVAGDGVLSFQAAGGTPISALTDTWTDSGTTYYGIKLNVTNTASASASKLFDLQIAGVTIFGINKSGAFQVTGPFTLQIPTSSTVGGNARGTNAVDLQLARTNAANVASGLNSAVLGYDNLANANQSYAFGYNNQATSTSTIAIGQGNVASGSQAQAYGINGIADGSSGLVFSTYYATNGGATRGIAMGQLCTNRGIADTLVYSSGRFGGSGYGDGQISWHVLRVITTDATANVVLTTDAAAASATNHTVLPNNSAFIFTIDVVCRRTDAADYGAWTISGAIKRDANAGTTAIIGTPVVTLVALPTASVVAPAVSANTTLGSLQVRVTGVAANTFRWVAQARLTEVTN